MPATSNWIIFFPIAFAVLVALQLSAAVRGVGRNTWTAILLNQVVICMFGFALLGLSIRFSYISLVWGAAFAFLVVVMWWKHRSLDKAVVLATIMAAETPEQKLFVAGEFYRRGHGLVRRLGARMRKYLQAGLGWAVAVERAKLPVTVVEKLAVRLRALYGKSPFEAESQLNSVGYTRYEAESQALLGRSMVCLWLFALIPITYLFAIFVAPNFIYLFDDLEMPVPPFLKHLDEFSFWLGQSPAMIAVVALLTLGAGSITLTPLIMWMLPWLAELPGVSQLFSGFYRAIGLSTLAYVCHRERNLAVACQTVADVFPLQMVSIRFQRAASLLRGGADVHSALVNAQLLSRREMRSIDAGIDAARLDWSLQQLAEWKLDRLSRRNSVIVQVLVVVATLVGAIVVGSFAWMVMEILTICLEQLVAESSKIQGR